MYFVNKLFNITASFFVMNVTYVPTGAAPVNNCKQLLINPSLASVCNCSPFERKDLVNLWKHKIADSTTK